MKNELEKTIECKIIQITSDKTTSDVFLIISSTNFLTSVIAAKGSEATFGLSTVPCELLDWQTSFPTYVKEDKAAHINETNVGLNILHIR